MKAAAGRSRSPQHTRTWPSTPQSQQMNVNPKQKGGMQPSAWLAPAPPAGCALRGLSGAGGSARGWAAVAPIGSPLMGSAEALQGDVHLQGFTISLTTSALPEPCSAEELGLCGDTARRDITLSFGTGEADDGPEPPAATRRAARTRGGALSFTISALGVSWGAMAVFCGSPGRSPVPGREIPGPGTLRAAAELPPANPAVRSRHRQRATSPLPAPPATPATGTAIRARSGHRNRGRAYLGKRSAGTGQRRPAGAERRRAAGPRNRSCSARGVWPGPGGGGRSCGTAGDTGVGQRHQDGVPVPALRRGATVPLITTPPEAPAAPRCGLILSLLQASCPALRCFWKVDAGSVFRARVQTPPTPPPRGTSHRGGPVGASVTLILVRPSAGVTLPLRIPSEKIP